MNTNKLATSPAKNKKDLKNRVANFLVKKMPNEVPLLSTSYFKDTLFSSVSLENKSKNYGVYESAADFLNFLTAACPTSDFFLFGGMLRDLAIFGVNGFNSDIDMVVTGEWLEVAKLLERYGASKNKFGGYRLTISDWDIDIWHAKETWAIKNGYVIYKGIESLQNTTILNWDSILMNWRTKEVICEKSYFNDINKRILDVKLFENPDPTGMLVRVLRHYHLKQAKQFSKRAIEYLIRLTNQIAFQDLNLREKNSYGKNIIDQKEYIFFKELKGFSWSEIENIFNCTTNEEVAITKDSFSRQRSLFDDLNEQTLH